MSDFQFSQAPDEPPPPQAVDEKKYPRGIPWYRTSHVNTTFLLIHLFTIGIVPLMWPTIVILATGDIYYDYKDAEGRRAKWSRANKWVATMIFVITAIFWTVMIILVVTQ